MKMGHKHKHRKCKTEQVHTTKYPMCMYHYKTSRQCEVRHTK